MSEKTDCKDTEKKQAAIDAEALDNVAKGGYISQYCNDDKSSNK